MTPPKADKSTYVASFPSKTRVALFCYLISEKGRATFVILMHTVKGSKNGIEVPYLLQDGAQKPTKEWVGWCGVVVVVGGGGRGRI